MGTSSSLLLDERSLLVLPGLATVIGLNEAIVLQQVHYWLKDSKHTREGRKWVYNTYEDWQKQFPFWSKNTLIRTFKSLETSGLLVAGEFNRMAGDRTKWYSIDYDKLHEAEATAQTGISAPSTQIGQMVEYMGASTQNEYTHLPKLGKSRATQNGLLLPETTIDYITETTIAATQPAATAKAPDLKVVDPWEKPPKEKKSPLKAVPKPKPEADATMQNEAVKIYCDIIRLTPDVALRKEIAARVTDKERWATVLKDWLGHPNWSKWNVMGQLDRYDQWEVTNGAKRTGTNGRSVMAANGVRPSSFGSGPDGRYTRADLDDDIGAAKYLKNRPAITGYAQS